MPPRPTRDPATSRSSRAALAGIFVVAALVRLGILALSGGHGEMEGLTPRYEDAVYALAAGYGLVRPVETAPREVNLPRLADSLAAHGERLDPTRAPRITPARWRPVSYHPPGYPLFLLAIYRTLGPPLWHWARWIQILADSAACLLVFAVGRRLASPAVGMLAALGTALFLPLAYLAGSRLADACTPLLFILALWLFLRALDHGRLADWALLGGTFGLLAQLRPDYLLGPPAFAAVALLVTRARRRALIGAVTMFAVTTTIVLPWSIRNARVIGEFTPGSTAAGMTLLQSVGQFSNPYGLGAQDQWYTHEAVRRGFESFDDPGADRMFRERYREILRANPGLVAGDVLRRLAIALVPPYHWGYVNPNYVGHSFYEYLDREHLGPAAAVRKHPLAILAAYWDRFLFVPISALLLAACVALIVLERSRWRTALIVVLPFVYVVLAHLPFFMTTRMIVPGVFAQMIAIGWCIERLRGHAVPLRPLESSRPAR